MNKLRGFDLMAEAIRAEPDYYIRELLFRIRKEKGLGLREVAEKAGFSHTDLHYLENGTFEMSIEKAIAVGKALGLKDKEIHEALHKDLDQKIIAIEKKSK